MALNKKTIGDRLSGKGKEYIPGTAFHLMTFVMALMDLFANHAKKTFEKLGVTTGMTAVDYGCGPARYIRFASTAVGRKGQVFAVDIHDTAIAKANKVIRKYNLKNVTPVKAIGYNCRLDDDTADLVYALDIFHMIENPNAFLAELERITKPSGRMIMCDGHQSRQKTLKKIGASGLWRVEAQDDTQVFCRPFN